MRTPNRTLGYRITIRSTGAAGRAVYEIEIVCGDPVNGIVMRQWGLNTHSMKIEHSPLMNEFISFWIETRVDGDLRYVTMFDFMRGDWYTTTTFDEKNIVLRGNLNSALSEDDMIEEIKPIIESAIHSAEI